MSEKKVQAQNSFYDSVLRNPDFIRVYDQLKGNISEKKEKSFKKACAALYVSPQDRQLLSDAASSGLKITTDREDNMLSHDGFGKYFPEESVIGIKKLFDKPHQEPSEKEIDLLKAKIKTANKMIQHVPNDNDKKMSFILAMRGNKIDSALHNFVDKNDIPLIILKQSVLKGKNKEKMLLHKYQASKRDTLLQHRYMRNLMQYNGESQSIMDLKQYTAARFPEEIQKAQQKETLKDKMNIMLHSLIKAKKQR